MFSRLLVVGLAGALVSGIALKVVTIIPVSSPYRAFAVISFAACGALTVVLLWRVMIRDSQEGNK